MDKNGRSCNTLVPGEFYIHTPYSTKGYLNAVELTNEKFVRLFKYTSNEKIFFRTGDIGRRLPNGKLDLIGREDRQIKFRGIRIEPDEIEAALVRSGLVKSAIVVGNAAQKEETLVAFVIGKSADHDPSIDGTLRLFLGQELPAYMIPSVIVPVDDYPLLSNGKVDLARLLQRLSQRNIVAPENATEERLLSIWKSILGDKPVSVDDNFTAVGGSSLTIMRLISRIHSEFNVRVSLSQLFSNLTIRKQAGIINLAKDDLLPALSRTEPKPAYNVSSAQQGLYYHFELNRSGVLFNLPMVWLINGRPDRQRIRWVLQQLIARHEALRTYFVFENNRLWQVVAEDVSLDLEEIDAAGRSVTQMINDFKRPFDLAKAPLLRCGILKTERDEHLLLADIHHIVCDGMSQVILFSEFLDLYNGKTLAPLHFNYRDYAEWEFKLRATFEYLSYREFWLKSFDGSFPRLDIPPLETGGTAMASQGANFYFKLEKRAIEPAILALQKDSISEFSFLLSVYFIFLSRLSGKDDLVVGINTAGRMHEELETVVGMFTKTLPIRRRVDNHLSFRDFAKDVHQYLMQAYSRQIYDLADIVRELNKKKTNAVSNLFETMFIFQRFSTEQAPAKKNDAFSLYPYMNNSSKYPLSLFAEESEGTLYFRMEYSCAYFTEKDIGALADQFLSLTGKISENADALLLTYSPASLNIPQPEENSITFNF
jgi:acyl carrier protein